MTTLLEAPESITVDEIIQNSPVTLTNDTLDYTYTATFGTPVGPVIVTRFSDEHDQTYGINIVSGSFIYMAGFGAYGPCEESVRPMNKPKEVITRAGHNTFLYKTKVLDSVEVRNRFGINHPYADTFPLKELIEQAVTLRI